MSEKIRICQIYRVKTLTVRIGYNDFKPFGVAICKDCRTSWNKFFETNSAWACCHWKEAFITWRNCDVKVQFT